jgi:predicted transglutaminase-like cysteine proteinase
MVLMKPRKVAGGAVLRSAVLVGMLAMGWGANNAVASSYMTTGGLTSQPIGHYEFCRPIRANAASARAICGRRT